MAGGAGDSNVNKSESGNVKAKSCKGCLYYSSQLSGNRGSPLCVGISRTLQQVPDYAVVESEAQELKEGRSLTDFKYACVGYSVFTDKKSANDHTDEQADLPFCVGIEILVDRRPTIASSDEPAHGKEDTPILSRPPSTYRPPHPIGDEFLSRLYRNAILVSGGVVRNAYRIGNYVKECLDDIF